MIGDNIKFYRKKNQLTQDDIASACNVTRQAVSKWENTTVEKTVDIGATVGTALAVVLSYVKWKSIGWAILHGCLGWVYIIYYAIRYGM